MKLLSLSVCCVLFLISAGSLHAQQLEAGLLINSNTPNSQRDMVYQSSVGLLPGFGIAMRYTQPKGNICFRNVAASLEWDRSDFAIFMAVTSNGIGGDDLNYKAKSMQFSLTDYLLNVNLFRKHMQLSLGFFASYKAWYQVNGSYTTGHLGWDTTIQHYYYYATRHEVYRAENGSLNRLLYGVSAGIGFGPWELSGHTFRCRLEFMRGLREENRFGYAGMVPNSLRFSLSMTLDKLSAKAAETYRHRRAEKTENVSIR